MELRVQRICQASSGGSHVTVFDADIELIAEGAGVEVEGSCPLAADPAAFETAKEAIRQGALGVLQTSGLGARIQIKRIVIHPVDFKPRQFERCTAEKLETLLAKTAL